MSPADYSSSITINQTKPNAETHIRTRVLDTVLTLVNGVFVSQNVTNSQYKQPTVASWNASLTNGGTCHLFAHLYPSVAAQTFLLKVTKRNIDGTTSIVKTVPCFESTTETCLVEVSFLCSRALTPLVRLNPRTSGTYTLWYGVYIACKWPDEQ